MKNKKNKSGFTLVELIVVVALFMVVGASVFSSQTRFIVDSFLDTKLQEVVQTLRMAQMRSMTRFKDGQWGVRIDVDAGGSNDHFLLFKGSSFASRDLNFDLRIDLPDSLSFSNVSLNGGGMDVIFDRVTGKTQNYGSFQIGHNQNVTKTISINFFGQIETS